MLEHATAIYGSSLQAAVKKFFLLALAAHFSKRKGRNFVQ
jgi:hypothetical protein